MPMDKKPLKHVNRRLTEEERLRHAEIRAAAIQDIPPKPGAGQSPSPPGIPAIIRQVRERKDSLGMRWPRPPEYPTKQPFGTSNRARMSNSPTCNPSPLPWVSRWNSSNRWLNGAISRPSYS